MNETSSHFEDNLKAWGELHPQQLPIIANTLCQHVTFCKAASGDENLKVAMDNKVIYLHSRQDPKQEAEGWFDNLSLTETQTLFVYKIGLGYCYDAAKNWLHQHHSRELVFLEDDPEVLRRFFESKRASMLLKDFQVEIFFLGNNLADFQSLLAISTICSPHSWKLSSLSNVPTPRINELYKLMEFYFFMNQAATSEYSQFVNTVFKNFYKNYLSFENMTFGNHLFGKFKGIPAIICGAGPSLDKNIELLGTLTDRALIFAGGTALNALNGKNIMPHFGVGIDPNPAQFTRLIMNHAYETPFFFRPRMLSEAVEAIHGDKLYISGTYGYHLGKWLEQSLGLHNDPSNVKSPMLFSEEESDIYKEEIEEGFNVLNFSTLLAYFMGCNPIICVGIDLAYTQNASYASGIASHPIHSRKKDFRTKDSSESTIPKLDIFGKPVNTLIKWVSESSWYSDFPKKYPGAALINATEGGIGFNAIPNMTLSHVSKSYLQKQYDLETRIHGEIQNGIFPGSRAKELLASLIDSLLKCSEIYLEIIHCMVSCQMGDLPTQEHKKNKEKGEKGADVEKNISELQAKIRKEPGYEAILRTLDEMWPKLNTLEELRFRRKTLGLKTEEIAKQRLELDIKKTIALNEASVQHAAFIRYLIQEQKKALNSEKLPEDMSQEQRTHYSPPEINPCDIYSYKDNQLVIVDRELDIDYADEFFPDAYGELEREYYPDGTVKYEQLYRNGVLHGPSTFYHEGGIPLATSWYIEGKRQGKMFTYYADGSLKSLQRYKEGKMEGMQVYYYPGLQVKSVLPHRNGLLDGDVLLFYPTGRLKRQLHFIQGKRFGEEKYWHPNGKLFLHAHFQNDLPVQTACQWYDNGCLAKQVVYNSSSEEISCQEWDFSGKPIPISHETQSNYFEKMDKGINVFTNNLQMLCDRLSNISQELTVDKESVEQQIRAINEAMAELQRIEQEINVKEEDPFNPKESIWHDHKMQTQMKEQFLQLHQKIDAELKLLNEQYQKLINPHLE